MIGITVGILLGIAVIAAEYLARCLMRRRRYLVWPPNHQRTMRLDPEIHPTLERTVRFFTNEDGERGGSVKECPAAFRCVVAGGSVVESFLVDQYSSWPQVLEDRLRQPAVLAALGVSSVHVGNIGKAGVDSRALKLILEKVLPQYDPPLDLIMTIVGASDVSRWLEIGAPAGETAEPMSTSECFSQHPDVELSWNPRHTAISHLARDIRQRRRSSSGAARWYREAREMRANATRIIGSVPDAEAVCGAFKANMESIIATARAHAKHLIMVRQPWLAKENYSADEEAMFWHGGIGKAYKGDRVSTYFSAEVISELLHRIDEIAVDVARQAQVPHVDLKPVLEMSTEHFFDQFHSRASASEPIARCLVPIIINVCRAAGANQPPSGCERRALHSENRGEAG